MATTIKRIVSFMNVASGATVSLPHHIRDDLDQPQIPDHVEGDAVGFTITADDTDVTITNTNPDPASINVLCELWHSIERAFGDAAILDLVPRPFVLAPGGASGATQLVVQDEGVLVGVRGIINFIGDGVAAVDNPGDNRVDITVTGFIAVQDEGVLVGARPTINFIGDGVAAVDNPGDNRIDVTIAGASPTDLDTAYHNGRIITGDVGNIEMNIAGLGETSFDDGIQLNNPTLATALLNQFTPSWVQWGSGWKTSAGGAPSPIGFAVQGQPIGGINYSEGELHFLVNPDGGGFYSMGAVDSLGFFRAQQFGGYGFVGGGAQGLKIDAGLTIPQLVGTDAVDIYAGTPASVLSAHFIDQGIAINAGLVGAPGLFPNGDLNTGIYQAAADTLSITAGGTQSVRFTAQGVGMVAGVVGAPSIFVLGDTDTGIYPDGADQLAVAAGGVRAAIFTITGVGVPIGAAATPGLFIQGNSDTGLFEVAPNVLAISAGGTEVAHFGQGGIVLTTVAAGDVSVIAVLGDVSLSASATIRGTAGGVQAINVVATGIQTIGGTVANPSYSAILDTDTGIYFPAANNVAISAGNTQAALFTSQGLGIPVGLVGTPGIFFAGDVNTGIWQSAADRVDIAANGIQAGRFTSQGLLVPGGTNALPSHSFDADGDTGFYRVAADQVGITLGGTLRAHFIADQQRMPSGTVALPTYSFTAATDHGMYLNTTGSNKIAFSLFATDIFHVGVDQVRLCLAGTAAIPSLCFETDSDSGIYSAGANQLGFATNGTVRLEILNTGLRAIAGTAANPSYSFTTDADTGIYRAGGETIGFTTAGTSRAQIDNDATAAQTPLLLSVGGAAPVRVLVGAGAVGSRALLI